jgi:DNA-binding protein HU-beta
MPTDAERDPVEWAQHSALVAISVARTVLDLLESAVADRERIERLATTGRSAAETWLTDVARVASTVATGFGFEPEKPPAAQPGATTAPQSAAPPAPAPTRKAASRGPAARARPAATKARSTAAKKAAKKAAKNAATTPAKPRKTASPRPKMRKK